MRFRIVSFNSEIDKYLISSNTNESLTVTSYQIATVLARGNICTNAELTLSGFRVFMNNNYFNIRVNMDAKLRKQIVNRLKQIQAQQAQQAQPSQPVQPQRQRARARAKVSVSSKSNTNNKRNIEQIIYRGDIYLSAEQLCRKFNCSDVDKFKELYKQGYEIDVCLGKKPLPENKPKSRKELENSLFNKDSYWNSTEKIVDEIL